MKPGTFKCAKCRNIYDKVRPDSEAREERDELFPGQECELVCEDCFKEIMAKTSPDIDICRFLDPEGP